jgi:predicted CXXCH cytochrome family protein
MNQNDPVPDEPAPANQGGGVPVPAEPEPSPPSPAEIWRNVRWFLVRAAAVLGAFALMTVLLIAFAGIYTSRPEFCRSCHIMEPYYVSWQESSHRNVSCVQCHFAPGVGEKVRGKMLGLVQLAKYVTSSEGPRPAAEIPDASCLRSGCHETRLLSGRVDFQGVPFDHRPHLEDLRRGKRLRCTSCHSQIVQGQHMTVTASTCFLCHFKDEQFNEGLGVCTRCHQIPEENFDLGGRVTFNHDLAYERGVDCANCHGDLVRGKGEVPRERCRVCHNREQDLGRIDDHTFLHQTHVTDHKVDCLECHLAIEHSLDENRIVHAASDCKSCHPSHHTEQVQMLQGMGGKLLSGHTSAMAVARIACPSCHRVKEASPTGTVLWKASTAVCTECHSASDVEGYRSYHEAVRGSLSKLDAAAGRVRQGLPTATLTDEKKSAAQAALREIEHDLNFLRVGNDIHNLHYASALTKALVDRLSSLCEELGIEKPQVTLPNPKSEIRNPK